MIKRGDPVTVAYGVHGALNARAGFLVEDASELPADIRDYVEKLVAPYFCGRRRLVRDDRHRRHRRRVVEGRARPHRRSVLRRLAQSRPSHPSSTNGCIRRSFQARRSRCAPAWRCRSTSSRRPARRYFTTNIEDGIALADEALREEIAARYPEAWARIEARRAFMTDVLGIRLKPEVLPFSNIPAFLPPFWLSRDKAMAVERR